MTRRLFFIWVGAGSRGLAKSWEQPAFPNWSAEFVERMLTDSPWAKPSTVAFHLQPSAYPLRSEFSQIGMPPGIGLPTGIPGGRQSGGRGDQRGSGSGSRAEMFLTTRWSSALPIRQALAIQEFGRSRLDDPKVVELLSRAQSDHIVEIFGLPTIVFPQGGAALERQLLKTATIGVDGGRQARATSVQVPEYGMHLRATLRFPRIADLTAANGVLRLSAQAGPAKIEQQFKLKPMVYRGVLEM